MKKVPISEKDNLTEVDEVNKELCSIDNGIKKQISFHEHEMSQFYPLKMAKN